VVHQSVNDGDHAGGVGEYLATFSKRSVGRHNGWLEFVAAIDDVEQQIRVPIGRRVIVKSGVSHLS
jgi:hypothetical protein